MSAQLSRLAADPQGMLELVVLKVVIAGNFDLAETKPKDRLLRVVVLLASHSSDRKWLW